MNLTPDRQGYLGDLMNKSIPQLKELLERQEKILLQTKFVQSLPDKGEKTRVFSAYLRHLVEQKSHESLLTTSTDLKIKSSSPWKTTKIVSTSGFTGTIGQNNAISAEVISNGNRLNVINEAEVLDSQVFTKENNNKTELEGGASLESSLERMIIGDNYSIEQDAGSYINSYERVIKKAEVTSVGKPKYLPNRTLLDDHIPSPPYPQTTKAKRTDVEEESAVKPPSYRFQKSQLISVEESVRLISEQRALNEELLAQRAAKKLADQLMPAMDTYSPAETDMQYRDSADIQDQDSDDNDETQEDEYCEAVKWDFILQLP